MSTSQPPSYQCILSESLATGVRRITLNQPEKRNPIGPAVIAELLEELGRCKEDGACRVVVLTGAGKVFSAGGDLSLLSGAKRDTKGKSHGSLVELLESMHSLGKPIIASVNGHALAGGLGLMVACDLVVASQEATFGTTEIRVGLWPMMITTELVRNIGRKKTLELMLTGKRIDAQEAASIGLINEAVAADELESKTVELAEKLASFSPSTLRIGLNAFYQAQDLPHGEALRFFEGKLMEVLTTPDALEGLQAFLQKRAPKWAEPGRK